MEPLEVLLDQLAQQGIDPSKTKFVRHSGDTGLAERALSAGLLEEYQRYQRPTFFHKKRGIEALVVFMGAPASQARFLGAYRVLGQRKSLGISEPLRSIGMTDHPDLVELDLVKLPGFEHFEDDLIVPWSSPKAWHQWAPSLPGSKTTPSLSTTPSTGVNHEQRAAAVWNVLVTCAGKSATVTYGDLAKQAGGFHHRVLRYPLGLIQDFCLSEKLPPLTSIVVHGGDALPGSGFIAWDVEDLRTGQAQVFRFDWASQPNPFAYAVGGETAADLAQRLIADPSSAENVYRLVKVRGKAQSIFREALLEVYDYACAFCDLSFPEALDAAHIVPWAKSSAAARMDPRNGILLCSNHHEMFDNGWIEITEGYHIVYTDMERVHAPYSAMDEAFSVKLHGNRLRLPSNRALWPDPAGIRERNGS